MEKINRIGIFGGTFNPIDNAHLKIVLQFIEELVIDLCYIVPANISPFKTDIKEKLSASPENRIHMLNLALGNFPKIKIETYEIEKGGISYSVDTIKYIKAQHPGKDIYLLIGSDQAVSFKEWKEWEWILINSQLCIAMRDGYSSSNEIIEFLKLENKSPIILSTPIIRISASEIREKLRKGESILDYVPFEVEMYIKTNELYN